MNLRVLFIIVVYYAIFSALFIFAGGLLNDFSVSSDLNESEISGAEATAYTLSPATAVLRFIGFVGFGVGLPSDTPNWFAVIFALWQSIVTMLSLGFVVSSFWDG